MINTAVCDDDTSMLQKAGRILEEYKGMSLQVSVFQSGEELLASGETFDLIFLDIDMQGISGIETARRLREKDKKVRIIYLTNYTDYSMLALTVHAFAYLMKTQEEEALRKQIYEQLNEVSEYMEIERSDELEFVTAEGIMRFAVKEILYFEYQNRMIKLVTEMGCHTVRQKITVIAEAMEEYGFAVPHKSFCVNLYQVRAIKGADVIMTDYTRIPLSQKKAAVFRRRMNIYLGRITGGRAGKEGTDKL